MDALLESALESAQLELDFERAKSIAEQIYEEERARILRVNLLLQEDANDELQEQLEHLQDVELKESERFTDDLQARLVEVAEQYEQSQAELKACMRDIDKYQIELNALNLVTTESSKTQAEKLALQRELNNLKPEIEHLRSLASTQDNVLADKLSLQRELATAQVELENEKRTIERLKQKTNTRDPALEEELDETKKELAETRKKMQKLERQNTKRSNEKSAADAALVDELETTKQDLALAKRQTQQAEAALQQAQSKQDTSASDNTLLEELKKELAKEKKALQKAEREAIKRTSEWDSEKEKLDTKLDAFRNKLRTTKEQLKEAQDELERREQAKFAESTAATKARISGRAASVEPSQAQNANPRKRNVARFDPDLTIGTPGNGAAVKKARTTGSNVGDKSTFSITPFLNRTLSMLPESPNAAMNTTINEIAAEADKAAEAKKEAAKKPAPASKKPRVTKEIGKDKAAAKPLKETTNRANVVVKAPALDKVVEEDVAGEGVPETTQAEPSKNAEQTVSENTTLQPKKKKLLGARKNIFDDDEPDGIKKSGKLKVGGFGLGRNHGKSRLLAEFSPLKKDRRSQVVGGVGA